MQLVNKEAHPRVPKGSEVLVVKRFKKYYIYLCKYNGWWELETKSSKVTHNRFCSCCF